MNVECVMQILKDHLLNIVLDHRTVVHRIRISTTAKCDCLIMNWHKANIEFFLGCLPNTLLCLLYNFLLLFRILMSNIKSTPVQSFDDSYLFYFENFKYIFARDFIQSTVIACKITNCKERKKALIVQSQVSLNKVLHK